MSTNDSPNGSDRLDRIERILENLANSQTRLFEDHELLQADIKSLLASQVILQAQIEDITRGQRAERDAFYARERAEREASRIRDERVDKLVSAIGKFISATQSAPQQ